MRLSTNYAEMGMGVPHDPQDASGVVIFKLPLAAKYYDLEYQSYVNVRAVCDGNPEWTCLKSNGINQTTLIVTNGGGVPSMKDTRTPRAIQGRIVSYDASSVKLDVGKGAIYTVKTPNNIVDQYNQNKVYTLAGLDNIYANTSPEDLKIKKGDSLIFITLSLLANFLTTFRGVRLAPLDLWSNEHPRTSIYCRNTNPCIVSI
jgi:hypothetical protein